MTEKTLRNSINEKIRSIIVDLEEVTEPCDSAEELAEAAKLAGWLNLISCRILGMSLIAHSHGGQIPEPRMGSYSMRGSHLLEGGYFGDRALDQAFLNALRLQSSAQYAAGQLEKLLTEKRSSV